MNAVTLWIVKVELDFGKLKQQFVRFSSEIFHLVKEKDFGSYRNQTIVNQILFGVWKTGPIRVGVPREFETACYS